MCVWGGGVHRSIQSEFPLNLGAGRFDLIDECMFPLCSFVILRRQAGKHYSILDLVFI